jgi:uncharacterized protein (TIGR02118 family)
MKKLICLVKRKKGITREAFAKHWVTVHAQLAMKLTAIKGYRINIVLPESYSQTEWDGSCEVWVESTEAWQRSLETKEGKEALKDHENFVDQSITFFVEEHKFM